jgi:hypothetical protein
MSGNVDRMVQTALWFPQLNEEKCDRLLSWYLVGHTRSKRIGRSRYGPLLHKLAMGAQSSGMSSLRSNCKLSRRIWTAIRKSFDSGLGFALGGPIGHHSWQFVDLGDPASIILPIEFDLKVQTIPSRLWNAMKWNETGQVYCRASLDGTAEGSHPI